MMTLVVIAAGVSSSFGDWFPRSATSRPVRLPARALVMAPFVTGFMSHHQWLPYEPMMVIHISPGRCG